LARSKEARKDEYYLSEIRQLKKLVKSLRQRIRQLEKNEQIFEDSQDDTEDLPVGTQPILPCLSCGKGKLETFEIVGKIYATCNVCGDRTRLK